MKRFVTAAAIVLLTASPSAYAQSQSGKAVGASELSPGDIKNDTHVRQHRGASELSPGDQMRDRPTTMRRGASELSPGDLMNDRRTTTRRGASDAGGGHTVVAGMTVVAGTAGEGDYGLP